MNLSSIPSFLFPRIIYLSGAVSFGSLFANYCGYPVPIDGGSMIPTLYPREWVWINSFARWSRSSERLCKPGEVAIFWSPRESGGLIIKRVIAIQGESVVPRYGGTPILIPRGYCWIEGDNAETSIDSNEYGPIPMGLFIGSAIRPNRPMKNYQKRST